MAIKFLHNISLENLELKNAKIDVVTSDPVLAGSDYEGRLIYNSADNAIKFHNGANTNYWVTLDGSGDISSVTVNAGTGLEVEAGSATSSSGAFSVTLGLTDLITAGTHGSSSAVPRITVDAQGRITAITTQSISSYSGWTISDGSNTQAIASGNTLTVTATDEIEGTVSATDTLTIGHADVSRSNTTSTASPSYGGTFTAIDSITSNARGHITAVNTKTVTIPASDNVNTTYDLKVAAGAANTAILQLDASAGDDDAVTFTGDDDAITITETTTVGSEAIIFTLNDTIGGARTFSGNITISGDLTVNGSTTTIDTTNLTIEDNIIVLNKNQTGSPASSLLSGIEVERGNSNNVLLNFKEDGDRWQFTNNGSTYYNIPITGEYNPTIGTDDDITTSGATVIDDITLTDGVITAASTRTLTLADLGGADNYVGWNLKLDGSNTAGGSSVASAETVEFLSTTSEHGGVTITNPSLNKLEFNVVQGSTTKRGVLELATNSECTTGTDTARAVTPAGLKAHVDNQLAATGFAVNLDANEGAVTKSSNTYTVTHGLASFDVIVQVVDISAGTPTYDTVLCDITRPTNGTVKVAFASSVTDDDYRVLIQKVM
jgi:hypothetical protein